MARNIDLENLSEDDKAWLRSKNRGHLIPADEPEPEEQELNEASKGESEGEGGEEEVTYADWDKKKLQEELGNRGLPKSGTVAELIERLEADDADAEDEEDDEE